MLQRLFQRQVSANRVEGAVEHSKAMEERDALRERSATILARLEHKRAEVRRRAEAARHKAEQEAAQAEPDGSPELAESVPAARPDEAAMPAEPAGVDIADETMAAPEPGMAAMPVEDLPVEDVPVEDLPVEDLAPEEPVTGDPVEVVMPEDDMEGEPSADERSVAADEMFRESEPLRNDVDSPMLAPEFDGPAPDIDAAEDGDALSQAAPADDSMADEVPAGVVPAPVSSEPSRTEARHEDASPSADDDAHEQIRKKAEEARLRIARRLEEMKREQEAAGHGPGASERLDLGDGAPPLSPRAGDEPEG